MSKNEKHTKVWVSVEDLTNDPSFVKAQEQEFVELPVPGDESKDGTSRRDFLKYVGFGLGAATVASCEAPVKKAIPYVVKPEEIVPGVATYFASTFVNGGDCVPVLVKTREGRPIKIEGNPEAFTQGGTSARSQASVLSLYDTNRAKGPMTMADNKAISWADLDKAVAETLTADSTIYIVAQTILSPTTKKAIADFTAKFPNAKLVQYDSFSASALLDANKAMHNMRAVPNYHFDKAQCVVGIEADFLGTWISPVEYTADYVTLRKTNDKDIEKGGVEQKMSRHIQFESGMSLTGSNADHRVLVKPSEQALAIKMLHAEVAKLVNGSSASVTADFAWAKAAASIKNTAKNLVANKGNALVVCGINDVNVQMVVNSINDMLGAYGSTITWANYSKQRAGNDTTIKNLVESGLSSADAVFVLDANPVFDLPGLGAKFAEGLKSVKLSVSFAESIDETAAVCTYLAPTHNSLEAWGDVEPKAGEYYLIQPTINPLFDTRAAGLSFLTWAGVAPKGEQAYFKYLQASWKSMFAAEQRNFRTFWQKSLHAGFYKSKATAKVEAPVVETTEETTEETIVETTSTVDVSAALAQLTKGQGGEVEVTFYETVNLGAGQYANNPWLQEMPDPIMRTTWDNFLSIPIKWDGDNNYTSFKNLKDGDIVTVTVNGVTHQLPVIRQFGQLEGTVSIGLGYGRTVTGKAGKNVGKDFFPAVQNFNYTATTAEITDKEGRDSIFACVQMHHTYGLNTTNEDGSVKMHQYADEERPFNVDEQVLGHRGFQGSLTNRSVFFQSNAKDLDAETKRLVKKREGYQYLNNKGLYPEHEVYKMGHHWGMAIDLSSCTGCGACTIACMAENNVPVVGKYEVSIAHEMTWLRIDRYYYGNEETPNAVYMPMMCQHCDNAPCENVCPVAATNHSSEGLNQMTYNRCVGTRYCANNCPFKVRRFNWLDYTSADLFPSNEVNLNREKADAEYHTYMTDNLTRMVLNPDVTVRTRGVIEKCSFCVQRLQEGKLKAKVEGRRLKDEDVTTACVQACPSGAIVFGDMNDKNNKLTELRNTKRSYIPIEETNVGSSVTYLMKVTNRDDNFTA